MSSGIEAANVDTEKSASIERRHGISLFFNECGFRMALKAHAEACQAFVKFLTFGEIVAIGACLLEAKTMNDLANSFDRLNLSHMLGERRFNIAVPKGVMDLHGQLAAELSRHIGARVMIKEVVTLGLYEIVGARDVEIRATSACVARFTKRGARLSAACG